MIYPVRLSKWFSSENGLCNHELLKFIVDSSTCCKCNRKVKWEFAFGDHSLIAGVGDLYCSKKCFNKKEKDNQ